MVVEQGDTTLAALLPELFLDTVVPFDVDGIVDLVAREFVGVFLRVDDARVVPPAHRQFVDGTIDDEDHLAAEAVIHVQRFLSFVLFGVVFHVRTDDTAGNDFRHAGGRAANDRVKFLSESHCISALYQDYKYKIHNINYKIV